MSLKLAGKTVLLTGASKGFGKALAKFLWREGASLILVARSEDELKALAEFLEEQKFSASQAIEMIVCDVMGLSKEMIAGRAIDVLINNAAIQGPIGLFETNDWDEWQRTIEVDLIAPVFLSKLVLPQMKERKRGKIINLSGGGATSCRPGFSAYAVAKTGLVRFTEVLAKECEADHIDVNAVAPGMMPTNMTQEVLAAGSDQAGFKEYDAAVKMGGQGEDATTAMKKALDLCVYLASDVSNGVTGKIISAVWDPWETLHEHVNQLQASDVYTLRRIVPKEKNI